MEGAAAGTRRRSLRERCPVSGCSQKMLSWRAFVTMENDFCIEAVEEAIHRYGTPGIFRVLTGRRRSSITSPRGHSPRPRKPNDRHLLIRPGLVIQTNGDSSFHTKASATAPEQREASNICRPDADKGFQAVDASTTWRRSNLINITT